MAQAYTNVDISRFTIEANTMRHRLTPAKTRTAGQLQRFQRDIVIVAMARAGFPTRFIAAAFDINAHSRVQTIVNSRSKEWRLPSVPQS